MSVFSTGVPMGYPPTTGITSAVESVQKMSQQVQDLQTQINEAKKKKSSDNDNDQSTKVFSPTAKSTSAAGSLRSTFTA